MLAKGHLALCLCWNKLKVIKMFTISSPPNNPCRYSLYSFFSLFCIPVCPFDLLILFFSPSLRSMTYKCFRTVIACSTRPVCLLHTKIHTCRNKHTPSHRERGEKYRTPQTEKGPFDFCISSVHLVKLISKHQTTDCGQKE